MIKAEFFSNNASESNEEESILNFTEDKVGLHESRKPSTFSTDAEQSSWEEEEMEMKDTNQKEKWESLRYM